MPSAGRCLARVLAASVVATVLTTAALASDASAGEGNAPSGQGATTADGRDLRSLIPAFLRQWFGGESAAPAEAVQAPAEGDPAGRSERRDSLVPLVEPLWIDLTPAQQQALAPFAPEWNTWSAAEKKSWVALASRLVRMSTEQRAKAERRILEWANLTPAQRRLARENYRLAKERPPDQRVTEWRNYQSLTEEQQAVLRKAGTTSNTAAGHAGATTGLAKEASQPLPRGEPPTRGYGIYPARGTPR